MNRPLVIAHRGHSVSAPENTLAAIREAIELGTDCVEVDVRCTRDGIPVLHHDPAIGRTAGDIGNVSDLALEDLRSVDVGSRKGEKYRGETIPTLEEAVLLAREKTRIVAEVKVDCAQQISSILQRLKIRKGLFFSAFRLDLLQKVYRTMPDFEVVWVLTAQEWVGLNCARAIETASESEITVVAPPLVALSEPSVCCAHEMGIAVWAYQCDDNEGFRKALDVGVDGIVTSRPEELLTLLHGAPHAHKPASPAG